MATISFSGIASGLDTDALINATAESIRQQRVAPKETKITSLTEANNAFSSLKTKAIDLQQKIKAFATLSGGGVAKLGASDDESVASATVGNGALNGSYDLTVTSIAKNGTYSIGSLGGYASTTALIGGAGGTVQITVGSAAAVSMTVDGTTTLESFVESFNAQSSNAEANIVNIGTTAVPNYRIVINSTNSGTAEGTITANLGTTTAFDDVQNSAAANAQFTLAGIGTIVRSTNNVSDVIAGVTFNLKSLGDATISISEDSATTASRVQEVVDSYNEIVTFLAENNKITRDDSSADGENIFAPLRKTTTDDNFLSTLKSTMAGSVASNGTSVRILADLGIKTQQDGTLTFNSDTFKTALASDPTGTSELLTNFADTTSLTGGTIDIYIRANGLFDTTTSSNTTQITNLTKEITDTEAYIAKQEENMRAQFARLESLIGGLQQKQSALSSALAGLSR